MPALTVSISKGRGSLSHNDRTLEPKNRQGEKTWDPEKGNENIVFKNDDLESAYHEIFDDALSKYNAALREKGRSSRQIKDYLEHIKRSKQEKPFYEYVVAVGNMDDVPKGSELEKKCQAVLTDYVNGFEKRNPNLYLLQAIMHNDEKGVPHVHIDFIPVSPGTKNGMAVKNSFRGAMRAQGLKGKDNFKRWREAELAAMISCMGEHDLEFKLGNGRQKRLDIPEYKKLAHDQERVKNEEQELAIREIELNAREKKLDQKAAQTAAYEIYLDKRETTFAQQIEKLSKRGAQASMDIQKAELLKNAEADYQSINKPNRFLEQERTKTFDQYIEKKVLTGKETGFYRIPKEDFLADRERLLEYADKHAKISYALQKNFKAGAFNSTDPGLMDWQNRLLLQDAAIKKKSLDLDSLVAEKVSDKTADLELREKRLKAQEENAMPLIRDSANRILAANAKERELVEAEEKLADYDAMDERLWNTENELTEAKKTIREQQSMLEEQEILSRENGQKLREYEQNASENEVYIDYLEQELQKIRPQAEKADKVKQDLSAEKEKSTQLAADLQQAQQCLQQQIQLNQQYSAAVSRIKLEKEELEAKLERVQAALDEERQTSSRLRSLCVRIGKAVATAAPKLYDSVSPMIPEYIREGVKKTLYAEDLKKRVQTLDQSDKAISNAAKGEIEVIKEQLRQVVNGEMPDTSAQIRRKLELTQPTVEDLLESRKRERQKSLDWEIEL